jgi:hypothetical protein
MQNFQKLTIEELVVLRKACHDRPFAGDMLIGDTFMPQEFHGTASEFDILNKLADYYLIDYHDEGWFGTDKGYELLDYYRPCLGNYGLAGPTPGQLKAFIYGT